MSNFSETDFSTSNPPETNPWLALFVENYPQEYETYPAIWEPALNDGSDLYRVKVSPEWSGLDDNTYPEAIRGRVVWLLGRWMSESEESQATTHQRLVVTWVETLGGSFYPIAPPLREADRSDVELGRWRNSWSEALIEGNPVFLGRLWGLSDRDPFPARLLHPGDPGWEEAIAAHNAVTLEDWLSEYERLLTG